MRIKILLLWTLWLGGQTVRAQDAAFKPMQDTKAFTEKFNQATRSLTSTRSDFVQEKHLSFMEDNIVSKGTFRYKKDNKVRLEYTTPFRYLMVLNDGKMYIKDGGKVNKFDTRSNQLFRQINDMLINTLNGNVLGSKDYAIAYYENASAYRMELKPTEKAIREFMQKIDIYIDKQKLYVSKVEITEQSGDYTLMSFLNVQQNAAVQDEEFVVK